MNDTSGALCVVIVVVFLDLCLSCSFLNLPSNQWSLVRSSSFVFLSLSFSLHSLLPCLSLARSSLPLTFSTLLSHPSSSLFFFPLLLISSLSLTLALIHIPSCHPFTFRRLRP